MVTEEMKVMRRFKLVCLISSNSEHTMFNVFDWTGAYCGQLVIRTKDVVEFLQQSWKGNVDWRGNAHLPKE